MSAITLPKAFPTFSLPRLPRWASVAALLLCAAALAAVVFALRARSNVSYVTVPVARQTIVQTVTASGVVNPQNSISVGTQVSGTIASIAVDFNSKVKKGQVLARLDPSTLQAQLAQAQAALAQAQAQAAQADAGTGGAASAVDVASATARAQQAAIGAAQANVQKLKATLALAQETLTRDSALLAQGYVARATVDADRAAAASDQADVAAAQAAVAQAIAQAQAGAAAVGQNGASEAAQAANARAAYAGIDAARAIVQQDELNLQHAVITSPVDGTVVARDVSVGQTVAASLQTPTLFAIAQDLRKMEIDINVGEPDIGNVKPGENVDFTVLAYPNRTFHGQVKQVRINPQTVNNVVTYDVVVLAGNADGALLPGMTANASIDIATAKDALVVPIAALSWKPFAHPRSSSANAPAGSPWGATSSVATFGTGMSSSGKTSIFVDRSGKLARIPVTIALTTATQAAVVPQNGAQLQTGDAVVVASSGGASSKPRSSTQSQRGPGGPGQGPSMGGAMRGIH